MHPSFTTLQGIAALSDRSSLVVAHDLYLLHRKLVKHLYYNFHQVSRTCSECPQSMLSLCYHQSVFLQNSVIDRLTGPEVVWLLILHHHDKNLPEKNLISDSGW